jgi:hypothetical protein
MPLGKDYAFIWVYNIIKLNYGKNYVDLQTQMYNMLGILKQDWKKYFGLKNIKIHIGSIWFDIPLISNIYSILMHFILFGVYAILV